MLNDYLPNLKRPKLYLLCFAITFLTSGLIVNAVQCILYLTLRNVSKYYYRKLNWYLCATLYSQLVFIGDWWSGSEVVLYIDKDDYKKYYGKEHACCIMNHAYEIDWLIGWMAADRVNLIGNCKAYVKKVMGYVPIMGWTWKFSEFVFLERSFEKDRAIINKQVAELVDHPDPIWNIKELIVGEKHEIIKVETIKMKHGDRVLVETEDFRSILPILYFKYLEEDGVRKFNETVTENKNVYIVRRVLLD